MCELDYGFDISKTTAIDNGFVIVPAKLIAIVHQTNRNVTSKKSFHYFQISLGTIYQMYYY